MQNDKSNLKGLMRLEGFTLLELLIVMSIIVLLMSILLPCLNRAKESAYELFANQAQVDEEGKVRMEITKPSDRKRYDDIYMIEINPPKNCHFFLRKPHPSGMKLIKRGRNRGHILNYELFHKQNHLGAALRSILIFSSTQPPKPDSGLKLASCCTVCCSMSVRGNLPPNAEIDLELLNKLLPGEAQ